ncbi:excinuclease ABC subunit A [Pseudoalteromonas sp. G4]|jgi:Skp family chaperone for outer membrane proteins|uniref:excinuclease ABC subunit A n=1 Tax=Pseudoalteromonas sp. G4 TaxID=2992761 RepID=UPI00237DEB2E|nr:excinuclease ABC subunit A [Pseudoalteromonas sp. G4]MDE3271991.1 excinuclease ABC subunit A [Pseudoalteromonas sp. G4]
MKKLILGVSLVLAATTATARDDIGRYSVDELLKTSKAQQTLDPEIKLFFGKQDAGKVLSTYGEVQTNKKTNAVNKSDKEACQWVMLSALKAMQQRARKEGMNAVVNISSFYKKREFVSDTEFECGAGFLMAGVTLKGDLVKL